MWGRPGCLLQSAGGEANRILLASALSSMRIICPNRVSRRDWIIAVSFGCFVSLRTSSFRTNWYHGLLPVLKNMPASWSLRSKSSRLVLGRRPLGAILHSSNEPGELSQWLCHDDSTINIVLDIIIIISILIVVGTCTRSCARVRVSRPFAAKLHAAKAACPHVAAKPPCDPPCGRAQLVIINALLLSVSRRWSPASPPVQPGTRTTLRDHVYGLVYHAMCLFTPPAFAGYSFQPVADGGLRLSRPGCQVLRCGGLPIQRRSPTQALTGPSVE